MLGIATELLEGLGGEIGKIRMLAQHRQFAADDAAGVCCLFLRHAEELPRRLLLFPVIP
jgi:hypothetical protein